VHLRIARQLRLSLSAAQAKSGQSATNLSVPALYERRNARNPQAALQENSLHQSKNAGAGTEVSCANDTDAFHARFLTRQQAEHYRDRYTTGRRGRIDRMERAALRELFGGLEPLEKAMDLACGTGRLSPALAEVAKTVILADASPEMLALAREDHRERPFEFLETDAEHIALPDRSVDLVFCHRFLHHIHSAAPRQRVFREIARISRRYAVISYYTPGFRDRFRWWRRRLLGRNAGDRPANLRRFYAEARAAGLEPIKETILRRLPLRALFCLFSLTAEEPCSKRPR
jgi:ubiquinone/menaquinone biosynthesis C-methylase UbiE